MASNSGNLNAETNNNNIADRTTSVSGQQSTALLLDKSPWFSANGGNVIVVTMDQQEPW